MAPRPKAWAAELCPLPALLEAWLRLSIEGQAEWQGRGFPAASVASAASPRDDFLLFTYFQVFSSLFESFQRV